MLRFDWTIGDLTLSPEPADLEQSIYDQIGLAYQRYDYLTLALGLCPNSEYVLRTDANITGLEKLLEWSE